MHNSTAADSRDRIESALKTQIADILRTAIDSLVNLDRDTVYACVMDSPELLHDAFSLLRRNPQLFAEVLIDPAGQPVAATDDARLSCGETLGVIKTLILRGAARRFFRLTLGGPRTVAIHAKRKIGFVRSILEKIGLASPPPPKQQRVPGKGDIQYRSMRDYLRFDWQAPLLPHYVFLTPAMIASLGKTLFEIREPAELRALRAEDGRKALSENSRPLFLSGARRLMTSGGDTIDSELLWKLWNQMEMQRTFGEIDIVEGRKIIADIAGTSREAIAQLMPILGDDARLFVTFLFMAYSQLGRVGYQNAFTGTGGDARVVTVYAERLANLPALPPPSLADMQQVFGEILGGGQAHPATN